MIINCKIAHLQELRNERYSFHVSIHLQMFDIVVGWCHQMQAMYCFSNVVLPELVLHKSLQCPID